MDEEGFQDTTNAQAISKKGRKNQKKNNRQNEAAADDGAEAAQQEADADKRRAAEAAMLAAGDGADSEGSDDPIFGKKGKKNQKKGGNKKQDDRRQRQGGKKGKKAAQEDDEDEEAGTQAASADIPNDADNAEEEKKEEPAAEALPVTYPIDMIYCGKCGFPPEFCEWRGRGFDLDDCKKWLAENHPDLFDSLYTVAEETKDGQPAQKQKKKKKVAFVGDQDKKIRVIKLKRGGKKTVSSIVGLEAYGIELAEAAKVFSRKLGTGAAAMLIEYKELICQGVSVQGDVSGRIEEIITQDFAKFNIPFEKVVIEDGGNKKNRTMGGGAGPR